MIGVREITSAEIPFLAAYWFESEPDFLTSLGVDLNKMPKRNDFEAMLLAQISADYAEKKSYAIIWLMDEKPVGHCNVGDIVYGDHAFMHLHLWQTDARKSGFGSSFVKLSIPYFFENLKLKTLYCEPFALNPAPNRTLEKLGFTLEKEYTTAPGSISFEQPVKRWRLENPNG